jgi:hypothetical protein
MGWSATGQAANPACLGARTKPFEVQTLVTELAAEISCRFVVLPVNTQLLAGELARSPGFSWRFLHHLDLAIKPALQPRILGLELPQALTFAVAVGL